MEIRNAYIKQIKALIKGRSFVFPEKYLSGFRPELGQGMLFTKVTKKYVYCSCWVSYEAKVINGVPETFANIKKFPVCFQKGSGFPTNKLLLEELNVLDLVKILNEIKRYYVWQVEVNAPRLKAELKVAEQCREIYNSGFDFPYSYLVSNIVWDLNGDNVELPDTADVNITHACTATREQICELIQDRLTAEYGYTIVGFVFDKE